MGTSASWVNTVIVGTIARTRNKLPWDLQELAHPINVPIGLTVNKGNVCDVRHFTGTYRQIKPYLREGSRIVFNKGAHSKENALNTLLIEKNST